MLFKEDIYNNQKFSFEYQPKEIYTYSQLCHALESFTDLVRNDLISHKEIQCREDLIDGRKVRLTFLEEGLKEAVLERGYNEIHNILCRKPEFRKKLEKIGIVEPERNTLDFSVYLQFLYFFYITIYFIFPNVKFLDLFDPKNWSTENTIECDTGNEIYEHFIIQNLKQNEVFKYTFDTKMKSYDEAWGLCCDTYFKYYELLYYRYTDNERFEDTLSRQTSESYTAFMSKKLEEINARIQVEHVTQRSLYDRFLDFKVDYTSQTLNKDARENYSYLDFESILELSEELKEYPLYELDEYIVEEDGLQTLCEDDSFISLCMGVERVTPTIRKKYQTYEVYTAIQKIWSFEKYQKTHYPVGDGFTFLQEEGQTFFMSLADCLVIARTRIKLPFRFSYLSKRTYLKDRSDASKKRTHSIKESFKSIESDGFDAKKSAFRDDLFRIACRMQQSILKTDSPKEFMYFELPMNIQLFELCDYAERHKHIEQKEEFYQKAIQLMEEELM